jgi:hypothetical protein
MSTRWTVYLRHRPDGWEWRTDGKWWGPYKTEGHARGFAKRTIPQLGGAKIHQHADFEFKYVEGDDERAAN